jgi:predicted AlkP superfamily phosphohydrolase/phosphomutase
VNARGPRALLIGLDGATFDVLDRLVAEGTMPFLGTLMSSGSSARLRTVVPPLTPPAWTSLVTGVPPGRHGIFDFVRVTRRAEEERELVAIHRSAGSSDAEAVRRAAETVQESRPTMQYRMATSTDIAAETLWSMASRQDRRVAVLNFPVGIPPEHVEGVVVPGFAPWRHLRRVVWPVTFYDVLRQLPGFRPEELVFDIERERRAIQELAIDEYDEWIDFHVRREERWLEVATHVLQNEECDLVAVLFDGVDKLQHICWRFIDTDVHTVRPEWEQRVVERCRAYYVRLDEILAETVRLAGPETRVFVVSDHGFGPTGRLFYVNVWLHRNGCLTWAAGVDLDDAQRVGPEEITRSSVALFDWSRTTVAALTSGSNGLYVNVARHPEEPGVPPEEYEDFCEALRRRLLGVRAPDGRLVVAEVLRREEAFPGPQQHRAPDLTLRLADNGFVSVLNAAEPVLLRRETLGTHHPHGVLLAAGPGIAAAGRLDEVSILDVAPALLHSIGLPVPCDLEGRFPGELFEPDALATDPPQVGPRTVARTTAPHDDAAETAGEEQVAQRLKALGYLE